MATKTKKKKAPVTTDYGKAKQVAETIQLREEQYVDDYENKKLFTSYLRYIGKTMQREFVTKQTGNGLRIIRIT